MPLLYTSPSNGATTELSSSFAPSIVAPTLSPFGVDKGASGIEGTISIKGKIDTTYHRDMGVYVNAILGDFRVPHGALDGKQTRLAAVTVANTSTTINVDEDTDENGNPLFAAGMPIILVSELPESIYTHHQEEVTIDCAIIGAAYEYGTTAKTAIPVIGVGTTGTIKTAFAVGAFVQPAKAFPGSIGVNGVVGVLASYERPDAVTNLVAATAVTAQIDTITWTAHAQLRSTGGVVGGFDIYVLKHGEGICVAGAPKGIKDHFVASRENTLPAVSNGDQVVATVTQYYSQVTNALTTIDDGVFYAVVVPITASDISERTRYGIVAVASVTVPA